MSPGPPAPSSEEGTGGDGDASQLLSEGSVGFCWVFGLLGWVLFVVCFFFFFLHLMTLLARLRAAEDLSWPEQS